MFPVASNTWFVVHLQCLWLCISRLSSLIDICGNLHVKILQPSEIACPDGFWKDQGLVLKCIGLGRNWDRFPRCIVWMFRLLIRVRTDLITRI